MREKNLFCIWLRLIVAILISVEESTTTDTTVNVTSTTTTMTPTSTESTPMPNPTTDSGKMSTPFDCNCGNSSILCPIFESLLRFKNDYLVLGIGIAGFLVLIASAVLIAVCCDRKLRKRELPASTQPTEADRYKKSSEIPVNQGQGDEHPYYNESVATTAINHNGPREAMPYSTVYELAKNVPGEHQNTANASGDGCTYAEVAKGQKMRPNDHSNSADDTAEYADTAAVPWDVMRLQATGGGYEEAIDPMGAGSNGNCWEESNPYDGAIAVDSDVMKQRATGGCRGEAINMQNCGQLPPPDEDITLIDNSIYSNAAVMQRH